MKKITFGMLFITFLLYLGLNVFSSPTEANTTEDINADREIYLNIITSNKMEYDMVKSIVGDRHNVQYILSNEVESMNFKVSNEIVQNVSNMDAFIYNGDNYYEPWNNELIQKVNKSNLGINDISRGIRTISMNTVDKDNKDISVQNPYITCGIDEYKIALYNVKSAIQDKDPKNRDVYEKNYNDEIDKINDEINDIRENKKSLNDYIFISLDDKLDYLYRELGVTVEKVKDGEISKVIAKNNYDVKKVIILKDANSTMKETGFKTINLNSFSENMTPHDMIISNYKNIYEIIDNK